MNTQTLDTAMIFCLWLSDMQSWCFHKTKKGRRNLQKRVAHVPLKHSHASKMISLKNSAIQDPINASHKRRRCYQSRDLNMAWQNHFRQGRCKSDCIVHQFSAKKVNALKQNKQTKKIHFGKIQKTCAFWLFVENRFIFVFCSKT